MLEVWITVPLTSSEKIALERTKAPRYCVIHFPLILQPPKILSPFRRVQALFIGKVASEGGLDAGQRIGSNFIESMPPVY
ncbi:hypothetical protein J6590_016180 [Homalodisca vitripennis]|nr:hypothetical protein J6590_016180 [Homalodisca vitripennis]